MKETLKVLLPNSAVLGVTFFTNVELILKITLLLASLVYTCLHIALLWRKLRTKRGEAEI